MMLVSSQQLLCVFVCVSKKFLVDLTPENCLCEKLRSHQCVKSVVRWGKKHAKNHLQHLENVDANNKSDAGEKFVTIENN